jgi:hypothetical protein
MDNEMMLNDEVKYMNYANKLSDGVIERILRPDIIIVKDTNTQYEEKINKSNILINVSIVEKNILYKLIKNQNNNHEILINDINMIVKHLNNTQDDIINDINNMNNKNNYEKKIIYFIFSCINILFLILFLIMFYIQNKEICNKYLSQIYTFIFNQFLEYKKIINKGYYYNTSYDASYDDAEF